MDTNDKNDNHVRMIKPDVAKMHRKRANLYGVAVVLAVVVAIALGIAGYNKLFPNHSQKLINTVNQLGNGHHTCHDGLKQLDSTKSQLANSGTYNNDARESALVYLMSCNFEAKNTPQAMQYATQLDALYAQDGDKSAQKRQDLTRFESYMMKYNK